MTTLPLRPLKRIPIWHLSKTEGIATENIVVVTRFCIIFRIQKQGIKIKGTKKRGNLSSIKEFQHCFLQDAGK